MKTRKGAKTAISHEEVQRAIDKFKSQGGLIKRLPDQRAPARTLVGGKYAEFEVIAGFSEVGSEGSSGGEGAAA